MIGWMKAAAAMACLALAACGGGGGEAGDGDGALPGGGPIGSVALRYEALPTVAGTAAFQAQLNQQGARGYRYVGQTTFAGEAAAALFVKASAETFTYRVVPPSSDLGAQASQQGIQGFRFDGVDPRGVFYRQATGSVDTFLYQAVAVPPAAGETAAAHEARRDLAGDQGFRLAAAVVTGGQWVNLFEQSTAATARYDVAVRVPAATETAQVAQFDELGASGYRPVGTFPFADGTRWVYERDARQATTFRAVTRADVSTAAALLAQANAEGASGRGLSVRTTFLDGATKRVYLAATGCAGVLCEVPTRY